MKYASLLTIIVLSLGAFANDTSLLLKDGMTVQDVQKTMSLFLPGQSVVVKDYSKSWDDYNPLKTQLFPDKNYRMLKMDVTTETNRKYSVTCEASFKRGQRDLLVYNCLSQDKQINVNLKPGTYLLLQDVINRPALKNSENSNNNSR